MGTRWARFARGWLTALFSTLIAALSHTLAGGTASTLAVVASLAFAGMLCVWLAGKRPSAMRLAVAVAGSQLLFHQLFGYLGTPAWVATSGHVHGTAGAVAPFAAESTAHAWHPASPGDAIWMFLAHLAAAALTFLMLRHGERAFWTLTANARQLVRLLFPAIPGPIAFDTAAVLGLISQTGVPSRMSGFRLMHRRRGPPRRRALA